MVVFVKTWFYSGKVVVFGTKMVLFGQGGCIRAGWLSSEKLFLFCKVVVFEQKCLYSGKVLVFGQKWLSSGKSGSIQAKVVVFGQKWL